MSNGYYRFARVDTDDGEIFIDHGWGTYPEFSVSITENISIALTGEQYVELLRQMNEYGSGIASTGAPVDDDIPF